MPADIVFEICRYGSPNGLLSLARTSKSLREILMSRSSITVWKSSRQTIFLPIPDPPTVVAEPMLAALIYDQFCSKCVQSTPKEPCWSLLSRFCDECQRTCLTSQNDYGLKKSRTEDTVWQLVACCGEPTSGYGVQYQRKDLDGTIALLSKYTQAVIRGKRGSKRALQKFVSERKKAVEALNELDDRMRAWVIKCRKLQAARLRAIRVRFIQERHPDREFITNELLLSIECVKSIKPLSEEEWVGICPKICFRLHNVRKEREVAQAQIWKNARIGYHCLCRQRIRPSDWCCLPSPEHFPNRHFYKPPPKIPIQKMSIEELIPPILEKLKQWVTTYHCDDGIFLPTAHQNLVMQPDVCDVLREYSNDGAVSRKLTLNMGALDLAISVFWSDRHDGPILISRDVCLRNKTASEHPYFCQWGSKSAEEIIRLVKEDRGITAEKMDEKDHRFLCLNCHRVNGGSWEGAKVEHDVSMHTHSLSNGSPIPSWRLLDSAEANAVKARERTIASSEFVHTPAWYCQHCDNASASTLPDSETLTGIGVDDGWTYDGVIEHIMETHEIAEPVHRKDFVFFSTSHEQLVLRTPLELVDYEVASDA
ncbi:uncharacterized protein STEHIDRAFT_142096 [Stereum hirsutum FP-91666 SS1]|uniref:uncharacterized protein n=1 Tax=Stereum hirsutum (strain FP-91666) TaxID=721885 RepID=UPI0004449ADE|nr:uncharacterized protein STEHIDRAFT_142096 [Stereum hirsutum FP-91666 SS1]EIM81421.1 hypothetical protein STEHIDRAFT_142096 [Stereum hirsutum FP-91666 SS1]